MKRRAADALALLDEAMNALAETLAELEAAIAAAKTEEDPCPKPQL